MIRKLLVVAAAIAMPVSAVAVSSGTATWITLLSRADVSAAS